MAHLFFCIFHALSFELNFFRPEFPFNIMSCSLKPFLYRNLLRTFILAFNIKCNTITSCPSLSFMQKYEKVCQKSVNISNDLLTGLLGPN